MTDITGVAQVARDTPTKGTTNRQLSVFRVPFRYRTNYLTAVQSESFCILEFLDGISTATEISGRTV